MVGFIQGVATSWQQSRNRCRADCKDDTLVGFVQGVATSWQQSRESSRPDCEDDTLVGFVGGHIVTWPHDAVAPLPHDDVCRLQPC